MARLTQHAEQRIAELRRERPLDAPAIAAMAEQFAVDRQDPMVYLSDVHSAEARYALGTARKKQHIAALREMAEGGDDDLLICDRCGRARWVNAMSSCFVCHEAGNPETFCTNGCWAEHQAEQHDDDEEERVSVSRATLEQLSSALERAQSAVAHPSLDAARAALTALMNEAQRGEA